MNIILFTWIVAVTLVIIKGLLNPKRVKKILDNIDDGFFTRRFLMILMAVAIVIFAPFMLIRSIFIKSKDV